MAWKRPKIRVSQELLDELKSYKQKLGLGSLEKVIMKLKEGAVKPFIYGWVSNPRNNVLICHCQGCGNYYTQSIRKGLKFLGSTHKIQPCPICGDRLFNLTLNEATKLRNQVETKVRRIAELKPLKSDINA